MNPANDQTPVAIIIPILNEARTLGATLGSIAAQQYPHHLLEVLIVDGGSSDCWEESLRQLRESGITHRVISNPRGSTSVAVNIALKQTEAPWILWLSGHCVLSPDYIGLVVSGVEGNCDIVAGGRLNVRGSGWRGRCAAWVLSSQFGTGLASYRHQEDAGWAYSATYALYNRRRLMEVGGLDERLIRNQDNELVGRMRRAGVKYKIVDASAAYIAPPVLAGLWRRAWGNGAWIIWSWKLGVAAHSWYHLAPGMAILAGLVLLGASVGSVIALWTLGTLASVYAIFALVFSAQTCVRERTLWPLLVLPVLFFMHHSIYGLGEIVAIFRSAPIVPLPVKAQTPDIAP